MTLPEKDEKKKGEKALEIFLESGKKAQVPVKGVLQPGDIVTEIINVAEKVSATVIIMGASRGTLVKEWLSSRAKQKTEIPILVIPNELP